MTNPLRFPPFRAHDPEPPPPRVYVRRQLAMACSDCPAVYESDGGNCPACGSPHAFPIAKWLDRTTPTAGEALRGAKEGG